MITNFNIPMVGYHLKQGRILMTVAEKKEWYLEYEITVNRAVYWVIFRVYLVC